VSTNDVAPAIPETVHELAVNCVQFVQAAVGMQLDFTHETLPILDHYARIARQEVATRPEAAPLLAQAMGAYFGQVVAAELTGFWRAVDADTNQWLLCLQPVFLALNPVGVGFDVLFCGTDHAGPSSELRLAQQDREMVELRIAALPETSEEDYFTFSTRFDVVQIATEVLRSEMIEGGQEDVTFEAQDYSDEFES
jgi:hypothetical protein